MTKWLLVLILTNPTALPSYTPVAQFENSHSCFRMLNAFKRLKPQQSPGVFRCVRGTVR